MRNRLRDSLKANWIWWMACAVFNLGDAISTLVLVSRGSVEGNPVWHDRVLTPGFVIFKVFLVPCLVLPLLAMLLPRALMDRFIRLLAFLFLEVSIWNAAGISRYVTTSRDAGSYSFLEMTGIVSLLLFGALVLIVIWERMAAFVTARGVHIHLAGMMGRTAES